MSNDCRVVTGTAIGGGGRYRRWLRCRRCCSKEYMCGRTAAGYRPASTKTDRYQSDCCEALSRVGASLLVKSRRRGPYKRVNAVVCQKAAEARGRLQHETESQRRVDGGLGRVGSCLLQKRCRAASRGRPSRTRALTPMIRLLGLVGDCGGAGGREGQETSLIAVATGWK